MIVLAAVNLLREVVSPLLPVVLPDQSCLEDKLTLPGDRGLADLVIRQLAYGSGHAKRRHHVEGVPVFAALVVDAHATHLEIRDSS